MRKKILITVANILEKNGKFFLVKERKRSFARKKFKEGWNLPMGRLENESLIDCLIRETKEETGLDTRPSHLIGIYQYPKILGMNAIFFIFSSKILKGKFRPSREIEKIGWFSKKEIEDLRKKGQLRGDYILEAIKDYKRKKGVPVEFVKILKLKQFNQND
jgi:8-oxo-dGTP pyrophosphatase MutT (NUDIX family)